MTRLQKGEAEYATYYQKKRTNKPWAVSVQAIKSSAGTTCAVYIYHEKLDGLCNRYEDIPFDGWGTIDQLIATAGKVLQDAWPESFVGFEDELQNILTFIHSRIEI